MDITLSHISMFCFENWKVGLCDNFSKAREYSIRVQWHWGQIWNSKLYISRSFPYHKIRLHAKFQVKILRSSLSELRFFFYFISYIVKIGKIKKSLIFLKFTIKNNFFLSYLQCASQDSSFDTHIAIVSLKFISFPYVPFWAKWDKMGWNGYMGQGSSYLQP